MSTTTKLITADELLTMPHREGRSDIRLALIRGESKKMSPAGGPHGILCAKTGAELNDFVVKNDLGVAFDAETGFIVERDLDTVPGIDAAFVSHPRMKNVGKLEKFEPFAPDLVIEVLSPGNTIDEIEEKILFILRRRCARGLDFQPQTANRRHIPFSA